jgi:hypothetical protein
MPRASSQAAQHRLIRAELFGIAVWASIDCTLRRCWNSNTGISEGRDQDGEPPITVSSQISSRLHKPSGRCPRRRHRTARQAGHKPFQHFGDAHRSPTPSGQPIRRGIAIPERLAFTGSSMFGHRHGRVEPPKRYSLAPVKRKIARNLSRAKEFSLCVCLHHGAISHEA